jgi:REP element-mobilizing transposase RayT
LDKWTRFWKRNVTATLGAKEGTLWQTDFWDTQLRSGDSYAAKWEYVMNNPVRAGLVARSSDWRYQGELNVLRWRE